MTTLFFSKLFKRDLPDGKAGKESLIKILLASFFVFFVIFLLLFSAPSNFPEGEIVEIKEGWGLSQTAAYLKSAKVIRSSLLFKLAIFFSGNQNNLSAGDYLLKEPKNLLRIAEDIISGDHGLSSLFVTIPEGNTVREIALILKEKLPSISETEFVVLARNKEGFLFPDTYRFLVNVSPETVIKVMSDNFENKISELEDEIANSGKTLEEIITMASLIEEETKLPEDRRIVSGILWDRIDLGLALQVDATFLYWNGKNTYELTTEDLEEDHPYNTYTNRGLPPGPITNPGLDSILAALRPEKSPYLFYLSDRAGRMYYAKDFEEHKKNKELYLNLE